VNVIGLRLSGAGVSGKKVAEDREVIYRLAAKLAVIPPLVVPTNGVRVKIP
jgi:hypothetical protein